MKILFIFGFSPYPPNSGGIIRAYNLIKELSKNNEVHLVVITPFQTKKEDIEKMTQYCKSVSSYLVWAEEEIQSFVNILLTNKYRRFFYNFSSTLFFHPKVQAILHPIYTHLYGFSLKAANALINLQKQKKFDLVHIEYISSFYYGNYVKGIPVVLGEQNVEHRVLEQVIKQQNYSFPDLLQKKILMKRLKRYELNMCRKFHGVITVSEEDKGYLKRFCKDIKISVVPNGVDLGYFKFEGEEKGNSTNSLVITASLQYQPNIDGINFFCREIFPLILNELPDTNLLIVGRDPNPQVTHLEKKVRNIKIIGNVDDIRPYIAKGTVYVVPLLSGGGTRLKILEAMAVGKPIVSTSIGCQGLEINPGENIIVADEPHKFASETVNLLLNKNKRIELGKRGRELVENKYGWSNIVSKLEKIYEKAIKDYSAKKTNEGGIF